jgi:hypothetical protein
MEVIEVCFNAHYPSAYTASYKYQNVSTEIQELALIIMQLRFWNTNLMS